MAFTEINTSPSNKSISVKKAYNSIRESVSKLVKGAIRASENLSNLSVSVKKAIIEE